MTQLSYQHYPLILQIPQILFNDNSSYIDNLIKSDTVSHQSKLHDSIISMSSLLTCMSETISKWETVNKQMVESIDDIDDIDEIQSLEDLWDVEFDDKYNIRNSYNTPYTDGTIDTILIDDSYRDGW